MKWRVAKGFNDVDFKRLVGGKRETFLVMVGVVKQGMPVSKHKLGGKRRSPKSGLNSYDKLLVMLMYYREYRTFAHIAADYGISESQCWRIVTDIECRLIKSGIFHLSGKKLFERGIGIGIVVIDVTEHAIERPKRHQRRYYSGKKGKHTLKSQVVGNQKKGEIICTVLGMGEVHDFNLYKQSNTPIQSEIEALTDKGYLGIKKLHAKSRHPKKKTKKNPLTKQEKSDNREINRERPVVEHINRKIKIFKIMTERYRNRRRRFGLRINLICAIINFEL